MEHRPVVTVDVDHTLAKLLESALEWHNAEKDTKLSVQDVKSSNWSSAWGGSEQEADDKLLDFYHSNAFNSKVDAVAGANEVLKPLRRYFSFVAVTDRPRIVEKQTREWLDAHFSGVFDKLVFVDDDKNSDDAVRHKKDIYEDLKAKVVIGSDSSITPKAAEDVDYAVLVGSVPWAKTTNASEKLLVAEDWPKANDQLQKVVKDLDLKPVEKAHAGPKLARFTDDLVAVSTKRPAVFYANIINSKFTSQKQEMIRLQASEAAITTAIQTAEMLRIQKNATITKISTRYVFRRAKGNSGHRVPKLELILQRVPRE
uniref:DNA/RNA-binding protein Alba-like domain-containing protein n=1 Tax=Globisporangium ultimum (strain ATCC 200006 / CBS 805.95 / DAOM BR144) TaxID=431595 RepID=K3WM01_GLOUD